MAETTKKCTRCGETKPLAEFRKCARERDGYGSRCLVCHRQENLSYMKKVYAEAPRAYCACGCGERVLYPGAKLRKGHAQNMTHKQCSRCKEVKLREEFDDQTKTTVHGTVVRTCQSVCKPCFRARTQEGRGKLTAEQREKRRLISQAWYGSNKERVRDGVLRRTYGIGLTEYEAMKAAQNGACAMCGDHARPLVIDHCHVTKKVRGLLCPTCNSAIGLLHDDKEIVLRLLAYLETHE